MSTVPATACLCGIQNAILSWSHICSPCTSTSLPKFTDKDDFKDNLQATKLNHYVHLCSPSVFPDLLRLPHHLDSGFDVESDRCGSQKAWDLLFTKETTSGWWFQPLWKIWKSIGMIIPNIWENKKWQPNHQPLTWFINLYLLLSCRLCRMIMMTQLFDQDIDQ